MDTRRLIAIAFLLAVATLSACTVPQSVTPTTEPPPTVVSPVDSSPLATPAAEDEPGEGGQSPTAAVQAATSELAGLLGVSVDAVSFVSAERRQWSDGCLGLGTAAEICERVDIPGWRIVLRAQGDEYVVRTDEVGDVVRRELLETGGPLPPYAAVAAQEHLSEQLGVPVNDIDIASFERRDWPDACLGLAGADEMCAQVITPGYRVVVRAEGAEHVVRTDETGSVVRVE